MSIRDGNRLNSMVSGRPLSMHVDKVNPTGGVVNLTYTASDETQKDNLNVNMLSSDENNNKQDEVERREEQNNNKKVEQIELNSVELMAQTNKISLGETALPNFESKELSMSQTNLNLNQSNLTSKTSITPQLNIRMMNVLGGMTTAGGNPLQYGGYALPGQGPLLQNLPNLNINPIIQGNISSNLQTNLQATLQTPNLNQPNLNTNLSSNFSSHTPFMNFNQNLQQMPNYNASSIQNFNTNITHGFPPQNFPQNMISPNMSMNIPQNFNYNMNNVRQPTPQYGNYSNQNQSNQTILSAQIQSSSQLRNNFPNQNLVNGQTSNFAGSQTNTTSVIEKPSNEDKNILIQQVNSTSTSKTSSNINILSNFVQAISTLQKLNQSQGQTDKSKDPRTRKKKP